MLESSGLQLPESVLLFKLNVVVFSDLPDLRNRHAIDSFR
jgi:hypothetical protein